MNSKLMWIAAAGVGVLALVLLWSPMQRPEALVDEPPSDPGELVDAGRFVLTKGDVVILDESYTLFFHAVDGYMLLSQATLSVGEQSVDLSQQTQYDENYLPVLYQLAADTPSGTQIVSAQMTLSGLEMEVRVGLARQTATASETAQLALLDNNLIGHYVLLWRAIRAEAVDREFTAAIPQALLSLPGRVGGPNTVVFVSDGTTYEGKRFDLSLGDTTVALIEHDERLIGLMNETQGTIAVDVTRFPAGIALLEPGDEPAAGLTEREVAFASGELTLAGTLAVPAGADSPVPGAVIVHGSGPVDRNGNASSLAMDAYRQIAEALAGAGIASLRYDKRGVGESEGDAALASRAELLDDVRAAFQALLAQPEIDPERCILIGHSEGGYLVPEVAASDGTVAGIVLLAGASQSLGQITRWQVESLLRQQGVEGDALDAALAQQDQYTAFVQTSEGDWSDYSVEAMQDAMPWLSEAAAEQLKSTPLSLTWLREHYLDDPAETLRGVTVPVLAINGEKDSQVPSSEAARIEGILREAGNEDVTAIELPDLNHLLRHHPEEPNLLYRHLDEPVDSRVLNALNEWAAERLL